MKLLFPYLRVLRLVESNLKRSNKVYYYYIITKLYILKYCSDFEDKDILPFSNSSTDIWNIWEYGDSEGDCFDKHYTDTSDWKYSESMSSLIWNYWKKR